jgi:hypothetical protein
MLTERSKVPSEAKKRYFFPAKNPVDARREVVIWYHTSAAGRSQWAGRMPQKDTLLYKEA